MRKQYIIDLVVTIVKDKPTAEMVVERLEEEGLLVLGYGNSEIDNVVQKFTDTFGTTKTSKYDRFAADRLTKKYGSQAICGIIGLMGEHATEKFAPRIGSISQLEEKIVSVMHFLRTLKSDETLDI